MSYFKKQNSTTSFKNDSDENDDSDGSCGIHMLTEDIYKEIKNKINF